MSVRHSDPVSARAIAEHTAEVLRLVRSSTDPDELGELRRGWAAYAQAKDVHEAIQRHVRDAFNEQALTLKVRARLKGAA